LPQSLRALEKLTLFDVTNNIGLSNTLLPSLPFSQYTRGCDIALTGFKCPLPSEAIHCSILNTNDTCIHDPVSLACELSTVKFFESPLYSLAAARVYEGVSQFLQTIFTLCTTAFTKFTNRTCSVNLPWDSEPLKSDWENLSRVVAKIDPDAQICKIGGVLSVDLGALGTGKVDFANGFFPIQPLTSQCGRFDRFVIASDTGRNQSMFNTISYTTLINDACVMGSRNETTTLQSIDVHGNSQVSPSSFTRMINTADVARMRLEHLQRSLQQKDTDVPFPLLSQECAAGVLSLVLNRNLSAALTALYTKASPLVQQPALRKCELQFALLGSCNVKVDWSPLETDIAAVRAVAQSIVPDALMCQFDFSADDVNSTFKNHPVLTYNVTNFEPFPLPGVCTTVDRSRYIQWVSAGATTTANSMNFYYSWSEDACAVRSS
jgi:hypothetical protein